MREKFSMFHSATIKLTVWYLAGIMLLSGIFSVLIYNLAASELDARFSVVETRLNSRGDTLPRWLNFRDIRDNQLDEAHQNIFVVLAYANLVILAIGGVASYLWARRTLQPIEAAHEAQARFTSDASHELRTPLAVMKAELEVALRDKNITKTELRDILSSNLEEVDRLSTLADMLLKLARSEDADLKWQRFNLKEAVQHAIDSFGTSSRRIEVKLPKYDLFITANRESVTELFIILLDNALKYSPSNTPIHLTGHKSGGRYVFSIKNSGAGISSKDLPHIFRRFYRSDKSRSQQNSSGYGLGLSLAKKIIDLHHGEITATSIPDKETVFTVKLPPSQN